MEVWFCVLFFCFVLSCFLRPVFPFSPALEVQKSQPEMLTFLVLGFAEANWDGNFVAGVWRSCISQTDFKEAVIPKGEVMHYL